MAHNAPEPTIEDLMQSELDKINTKADLLSRQSQTTQLDTQEATNKLATLINMLVTQKDEEISKLKTKIADMTNENGSLHSEIRRLKEKLGEDVEEAEIVE